MTAQPTTPIPRDRALVVAGRRRTAGPGMGRPTIKTPELLDALLALYRSATPMKDVFARDDMPAEATFYRWMEEDADFRERVARARPVRAAALAERGLDVGMDIVERPNKERAAGARELMKHIQWLSGAYDRETFGQQVKVDGQVIHKHQVAGTLEDAIRQRQSYVRRLEDDPAETVDVTPTAVRDEEPSR